MSRDRTKLEAIAAYAGFTLVGPLVEAELERLRAVASEAADEVGDE